MPPAANRPATSHRAHLLLYALLCAVLVYVLIVRYLHPLVLGEVIAVEPQRVDLVEQQIDPNVATWDQLARLPGVGESLARRIVAYREEMLRHQEGPVFRRLEDLEPVHGIGPQLLERIRSGLKFPASRGR